MVGSHSHARELHASHFIPPLLCVHGWDMNTSRICPTFYGSTCIVVATSRYVESFTLLTLSVHVNLAALYIYCAFFEHFQQGHNFVRLINSSCKNLRQGENRKERKVQIEGWQVGIWKIGVKMEGVVKQFEKPRPVRHCSTQACDHLKIRELQQNDPPLHFLQIRLQKYFSQLGFLEGNSTFKVDINWKTQKSITKKCIKCVKLQYCYKNASSRPILCGKGRETLKCVESRRVIEEKYFISS